MNRSSRQLFTEGPSTDPAYSNIRDLDWNDDIRNAAETIWTEYEEYCPDADFLTQIREDFHAMTWQMQLAVVLRRKGFDIRKTAAEGPDICFARNGIRLRHEFGGNSLERFQDERGIVTITQPSSQVRAA